MSTAARTWPIAIRQATIADAALFTSIAQPAFVDTFGKDNTPEDMAHYCAEAFGEEIQRRELADDRNIVLIAERDGDVVGYAMLRSGNAPDIVADPAAIEIARLYALTRAIGSGVGAALMQRCLEIAAERGHQSVWLGVWEHNPRAIAFYEKWGFVDVGEKSFTLGRDHQTDRVMLRASARPGAQGVA
jgi:ribosomal protein S18 acetylase RimI-like enzyme